MTQRDQIQAPPKHIVEFAVEVSGWSPCLSKRGAVHADQAALLSRRSPRCREGDVDG